MLRKLFLTFFSSFLLTGCAASVASLHPPVNEADAKDVYIVSHGWHTGVVVRADDIPEHILPEKVHFKNAEFLEIGWGDKGFYQADGITLPLVINAIFWPSDSVVHMVGLSQDVAVEFPHSEIIKLRLSVEGYKEMLNEIHNTIARGDGSVAQKMKAGLYGDSAFYEGVGHYHMLRTCNNWTAEVLRASGFPITPFYAASASNVISQTYMQGQVIRMFERKPILSKRKRN